MFNKIKNSLLNLLASIKILSLKQFIIFKSKVTTIYNNLYKKAIQFSNEIKKKIKETYHEIEKKTKEDFIPFIKIEVYRLLTLVKNYLLKNKRDILMSWKKGGITAVIITIYTILRNLIVSYVEILLDIFMYYFDPLVYYYRRIIEYKNAAIRGGTTLRNKMEY